MFLEFNIKNIEKEENIIFIKFTGNKIILDKI
jgi:hypothetical protein